jgi:hypothetical protein
MEYGVWSMEYGVWSMEYGVWKLKKEEPINIKKTRNSPSGRVMISRRKALDNYGEGFLGASII